MTDNVRKAILNASKGCNIMIYLVYLLICTVATTLGAISGIGGGVIIKPVFDAFAGLPVAAVSFMSGCTVLAMSVVSLLRSRGGDARVEPRRGTALALGAAAGGVAGKFIFDWVKRLSGNDGLVGTVQSAIMVVLTAGVLLYVLFKSRIHTYNIKGYPVCVIIGLALGLMSAFLGIGGGPINLAILCFFFSMDTKTAALNSIYIIFVSQLASLATALVSGGIPDFEWLTLAVMTAGGVAGGFIGRGLSRRMSAKAVDRVFMSLLAVITLISCWNLIKYAAMV